MEINKFCILNLQLKYPLSWLILIQIKLCVYYVYEYLVNLQYVA